MKEDYKQCDMMELIRYSWKACFKCVFSFSAWWSSSL